MYDSVMTGKENTSKDWNCITSMFLTSFNVYFVFGYVWVLMSILSLVMNVFCVCALRLLSGSFWHFLTVCFSLVKTAWQPYVKLVYTPNCIRPDVRLSLDQHIFCSDCCEKMYSIIATPGSFLVLCTA